jgi:hypothetical protein
MASGFKYDITNMCHPLIAYDLYIFVGGDLWTAENYDAVLILMKNRERTHSLAELILML